MKVVHDQRAVGHLVISEQLASHTATNVHINPINSSNERARALWKCHIDQGSIIQLPGPGVIH